jgi:hydroxyacylglutathione hydrolase
MLNLTPIPAFNDNYIWAICHPEAPESGVIIVDPGSADCVQQWLQENNRKLTAILITHHHDDHTGGVTELQQQNDYCPVYGPANTPFEGITQPLNEGDLIYLLDTAFEVKAVPGHTLDHISYYAPSAGLLLCGDTLFMAGCGRLFEGTAEQMQAAMDYFASLPDDTRVYAAHEYTLANLAFAHAVEPENQDIRIMTEKCRSMREQDLPTLPSRIGLEKAINPFMRTRETSVIHTVYGHSGEHPDTPAQTLALLREWKNSF